MTLTLHTLETAHCPFCGTGHDRATNAIGTEGPGEGDFTICFNCLEPLCFTKDLKLRKLVPADLDNLPPVQEALFKAQAVIKKAKERAGIKAN